MPYRGILKNAFMACSLLLLAAQAHAAEPKREKPGYAILTPDLELCRITKYDAAGKPFWVYDKQVKPIDAWPLPAGAVLIAYLPSPLTKNLGGVRLVDAAKKTVFDVPLNDEIMSVQPLAGGNFLLAECHAGRVTEMDRQGNRASSFKVATPPSGHKTLRHIRLTPQGTVLVAECYTHKLREYDRRGMLLRELELRYVYNIVPLPGGHVLAVCWNFPESQIVELDADWKIVWNVKATELPRELGVTHIAGIARLPNGNTLVSASCKPGKGPLPRAMLFEITPDKQIVWRMLDHDGGTWLSNVALLNAEQLHNAQSPASPLRSAASVNSHSAARAPTTEAGEILFAERHPGRDYSAHYYANFGYDCGNDKHWLHGADGGRLAIFNRHTGQTRTLIADPQGAFRDPCIHYDGNKTLFSYRKGGTHHYNLYEINLDGSGLRQITSGDWDDVEPAYLPDGGIAFCSTRCKRYVLCWLAPVAVMFRCNADGSGLRQLSSNSVTENSPAVLPDGRILYTRWEYVNRDAVSFHHLWTMNPDGSGATVYFGNMYPGEVLIDAQPIPCTNKVVFVDSGYHGQQEHTGVVKILDPGHGPDDRSQAKAISGNGFRDPYPLSQHEFLAARGNELVTLSDRGAVQTLWKSTMLVHEPRLIAPRVRPARIAPHAVTSKTSSTGTLMLTNVYEGRQMASAKPGSIKKLLVLEDLPKPVNFHGGGSTPLAHGGSWTFKRILGTVPVEADGSASFDVPACRSIYLAALDENDLSVKQMRSFVTVQPGERVGCIGCHEHRTAAPARYTGVPQAFRRPPSPIKPFVGIPDILDFPRDIQPILDRHCVACHDAAKRQGGIVLSGDRGPTYSLAYYNLLLHRQIKDHAGLNWNGIHNVGGRPAGNDAPYSAFSSAAPLMKYILRAHHGVTLSEMERTTVRLWLDSAAPYAGTAAAYGTGQLGGWWRNNEPVREMADAWPSTGPAKDAMQRRCAGCHENRMPRFVTDRVASDPHYDFEGWMRPVSRFSRHTIFNLTRPEQSLALMAPLAKSAGGYAEGALPPPRGVPLDWADAPRPIVHAVVFADKNDPDYQKILAHLQAAKARLDEIKRFDMPGFQPRYEYLREMKRYGILPPDFDLARPAKVDAYELDQKYWRLFWHRPSSE